MRQPLHLPALDAVRIDDDFWSPRIVVNRETTLPIEYRHCRDTGRLDAWDWEPGKPDKPHQFWDSDVAKWLEAAAYSLAIHPDPELEQRCDAQIARMAAAQAEDGYLNSHFQRVRPEDRWTCLGADHELYCAGHLIEAAVAYHEATGKREFLDVMCRCADHIASVFGPGEDQRTGIPGHEEIELALVKLYHATGEQRYLDLARYFVDERGRDPEFFAREAAAIGRGGGHIDPTYTQAHQPVREQRTAEGHAVRACYLYAGMADVAAATGDGELLNACRRLFANITERRMYVTGGVGSAHAGERFTFDYDLPNESAYAETCAAISLVFFAQRLLRVDPRGVYADVMERALYNGVLSGVSQSGDRFFYVNPLSQYPPASAWHKWVIERQEWFGCACCPPNIARLLASLQQYVYGYDDDSVFVHLYVAGEAELPLGDRCIRLRTSTEYPWDGRIDITVEVAEPTEFTLALRIPSWARCPALIVAGDTVAVDPEDGYQRLIRTWQAGDTVTLHLPLPSERIEANPQVRQDAGCVALQRGPVVYCLEEVDNGPGLADFSLPDDAELKVDRDGEPFPGIPVIRGTARRRDASEWSDTLYRPLEASSAAVELVAIPYYLWANRAPGEMTVWLRR